MLVTPTFSEAASCGMVISSTGVVRQYSKAPATMSAGLIEPRARRGRFGPFGAEAGTRASPRGQLLFTSERRLTENHTGWTPVCAGPGTGTRSAAAAVAWGATWQRPGIR